MELGDEYCEEIYQNLFVNPLGLDFDALWTMSKIFSDKADISRCLFSAKREGHILKDSETLVYKLSDEKYKELSGGVEPPKEVQAVLSNTKTTKVSKKPKDTTAMGDEPKIGNLRRNKLYGAVCLAIYLARETEGLSFEEVVEWAGINKEDFVYTAPKLTQLGYVRRSGSLKSKSSRFMWTGKFIYPFPTQHEDDVSLLKYPSLFEFQNRKIVLDEICDN